MVVVRIISKAGYASGVLNFHWIQTAGFPVKHREPSFIYLSSAIKKHTSATLESHLQNADNTQLNASRNQCRQRLESKGVSDGKTNCKKASY